MTASERAYGPPRLRAGSGSDETEFVKGTLWSKDEQGNDLPPSVDDIKQGKLFDCYLMAALAAVADATPEKIVNMIEDHGRGVYTVHFRELGWAYVAPSVTADFTKPNHAKTTGRQALWPLIIEKAYGVVKGGVDQLNTRTDPAKPLRDMFDMKTSAFYTNDKDADAMMAMLAKANSEKKAVTALSPAPKSASEAARRIVEEDPTLVFSHAYAMVDVNAEKRQVKLFNPWAERHPNGDGWMTIEAFKTFFHYVNVSG